MVRERQAGKKGEHECLNCLNAVPSLKNLIVDRSIVEVSLPYLLSNRSHVRQWTIMSPKVSTKIWDSYVRNVRCMGESTRAIVFKGGI